MAKHGFFSDGVNINAKEAEQKLDEYQGIAKPTPGQRPKQDWEARILERTPHQRRVRWVMFRILKLGIVGVVFLAIAAVSWMVAKFDTMQIGIFDNKFALGNAKVSTFNRKDSGEISLKITSDDEILAIYDRAVDGKWTQRQDAALGKDDYEEMFSTDADVFRAYSGKDAGRLTFVSSDDEGKLSIFQIDEAGNIARIGDGEERPPEHTLKYEFKGYDKTTISFNNCRELLLEIKSKTGRTEYYDIAGEGGLKSRQAGGEGSGFIEALVAASNERRAKILRFGDMVQISQFDSSGRYIAHSTINTKTGVFVDFDLREKGAVGEGTAGESTAKGQSTAPIEAFSWLITAILVFMLFKRDLRLLVRYLGPPMRPMKAALMATLTAVASKAIPLLIAVFFLALPFMFGYLDNWDDLKLSENLRNPLDNITSSPYGIAYVSVIAPVAEELIFRGALFLICLRIMGRKWAVIVTTVLFILLHFMSYPMSIFCVFAFALAGSLAAIILLKTHRLRWPMLFHSVFNVIAVVFWSLIT
ncbi:MAG: CPBP family intramembrane metalloprotease [Candidatus Coatesbacteria bacterium]|nr:CPBP family intramembrane metalloprotease [Candidatus Coatesbacteria bacterium]